MCLRPMFLHTNSSVCLTYIGSILKRCLLLLDSRHGLKLSDRVFLKDIYNYYQYHGYHLSGDSNSGGDSDSSSGDSDDNTVIDCGNNTNTHSNNPHKPIELQFILTKCDLIDRMELGKRLTYIYTIYTIYTIHTTYTIYTIYTIPY